MAHEQDSERFTPLYALRNEALVALSFISIWLQL